ncbi:MAG: SUMF1/EgtB/PvdO family nonheme iron enzyme [Saprospiraceae bacterium]|nr:SUMF1/EgtB/PvdO family nonheme iron enzyme [Saprospiraceae bacterium]
MQHIFLGLLCWVATFSCQSVQPDTDTILLSAMPLAAETPAKNRFRTGNQYLEISQLQVQQDLVQFRLQWSAGWRDAENYDAAWIFAKAKTQNGQWIHLQVKPQSPQLLNANNTVVPPEFEVPEDQMGVYVYRSSISEGDNDWQIQLQLEGRQPETWQEVRLFGLEMVYIPEGSYELGTLKSLEDRREVLTPGAGGAPYNSLYKFEESGSDGYGGIYKVSSEKPIDIGPKNGNLFWTDIIIPGTPTYSGKPEGRLAADFPKGYRAFYQMKYELSQQQYCDFLNTLRAPQQQARDFTRTIEYGRPISDYRNTIQYKAGQYSCSRPHRPCNFLSWLDGQAYADWAGLRHMTELEFEKSCRGPQKAIYREYVWGVNEINEPDNLQFINKIMAPDQHLAKAEKGNEITDGNTHVIMFAYYNIDDVCKPGSRFYDPDCVGCRGFQGGDGGRGPVRSGICGTTATNRIQAGATYYGAMDMGGNLQEPVVTIGHPSGRRFGGSHGDGQVSKDGRATNEDWQPIEGNYAFGGRGGCWKYHQNHARTADRFKGLRTRQNRRASHIGFRGVRTQ